MIDNQTEQGQLRVIELVDILNLYKPLKKVEPVNDDVEKDAGEEY